MSKSKPRPKLVKVFSHDKDGSRTLPEDVVAVFNLMQWVVITNGPGMSAYFIDVYPWYEVNEYGDRITFNGNPNPVYYMKEKKTAFDARKEITKWVRDGCPEQEREEE